MSNKESLIRMEELSKVYHTDSVETKKNIPFQNSTNVPMVIKDSYSTSEAGHTVRRPEKIYYKMYNTKA